jgi:hypothetical protein
MDLETLRRIERIERVLERLATMERPRRIISWGAAIGLHLALPALRAFWPMSSVDQSSTVYDLSGQERHLSNPAAAPRNLYNSVVPYVTLDGSTQYLARSDEAGLDITTQLTFGGWFWLDTAAANMSLIGKFNATGNQRAWVVQMLNGTPDAWRAIISADGSASVTVINTATVATGVWNFVVTRFTPSTELALFVNAGKATNTSSIPATLFNSSSDFRIGAQGNLAEPLDGRAALCFVCAAALPDALITDLYLSTAPFFA